MNKIKFKKLNEKAKTPTRHHVNDAGIDFYSLDHHVIEAHSMKVIGTGIAIELPKGTMGLCKPKGKSTWLIGSGVIDEGYRGEIMFRVFNTNDDTAVVWRNDPVAQLVVVPILTPRLEEVQSLTETVRSDSAGITNTSHEKGN